MASFDLAIDTILKNEGGLVNNPRDPGGITNFGISLRFLASLGLKYDFNKDGKVDDKEIKELTPEHAKLIYQNEFWLKGAFDKVINQKVATYLFDMAVNMGVPQAIKLSQRSLWAINKQYHFVDDDGLIGSKTLDAINQAGLMLIPVLMSERAGYYRMLAALKPENHGDDLNGWLNRTYRAS